MFQIGLETPNSFEYLLTCYCKRVEFFINFFKLHLQMTLKDGSTMKVMHLVKIMMIMIVLMMMLMTILVQP